MKKQREGMVVSECAGNVDVSVASIKCLCRELKDFVGISFGADNINFSHFV